MNYCIFVLMKIRSLTGSGLVTEDCDEELGHMHAFL